MSRKMKRGVMEASPYAVYEDAKSRFKHQSLLQDYLELQKVISLCGFGRSGYSSEFPLWGSLDFVHVPWFSCQACLVPEKNRGKEKKILYLQFLSCFVSTT